MTASFWGFNPCFSFYHSSTGEYSLEVCGFSGFFHLFEGLHGGPLVCPVDKSACSLFRLLYAIISLTVMMGD